MMKLRSLAPVILFLAMTLLAAGCASSQPEYTPYGSLADYERYGYGPYNPAAWWPDPFWMYQPYWVYQPYWYYHRGVPKRPGHKGGPGVASAPGGTPARPPTEARAGTPLEPAFSPPSPETGHPVTEATPSFRGSGGFGHGGHSR